MTEFERQDGVGESDGLQRLWTPHRMAYIKSGADSDSSTGAGSSDDSSPKDSDSGCPFCRIPQLSDEDGLIVSRGETVFAVLNLYPYNPGHLMVVPYRHVADYTDLTLDETHELAKLTRHAMTVARQISQPHGFNIGMNQGSAAGAGIAAHLHQHVVPRWGGDSNFMPVIGHTKVLPQLLGQTRQLLADAWVATG